MPAWWLRGIIKSRLTCKSSARFKESKCVLKLRRQLIYRNRVIGVRSQIEPGSKVQEQFLPKKNTLW